MANIEEVKNIVSKMSAEEQFEILQCIEKNFFIPVVMGKEYLATLFGQTYITSDDLKSLQDNISLNDEIIETTHEKLHESGMFASDDEHYTESEDEDDEESSEDE